MFWSKSVPFKAAKDIPSLEGKVILVTGGSNGLGKQSVLEYARHNPAQIWLAARNLEKAQAAVEDIKKEVPDAPITVLKLDLASLQSVKDAAAKFSAESDRLDILLLNAGVMAIPPAVTEEGYEIQFGTNHVGHALLTKLLVPVLDKTAKSSDAGVRIVSLGSYAHNYTATGGIDFKSLKSKSENMSSSARYGQSKLACILFARQLAKEYPQFTSVSLHPGLVRTNLFHAATDSPAILRLTMPLWDYFLVTPEDGAKNQLWASVAKDVKNGEYYEPIGIPGRASSYGKNDELAKKLWDWTEKELESYTI